MSEPLHEPHPSAESSDVDVLLTIAEVGEQLKVRDRRTAIRSLEHLGIPILRLGRGLRVRKSQLDAAIIDLERRGSRLARHARSEKPASPVVNHLASPGVRKRRDRGPRTMSDRARRGWTESLGDGLFRRHRLDCRASKTRKPDVRCDCPFACHQPTGTPGRTSLKTIKGAETRTEARRMKKALQADRSVAKGDGTILFDSFFKEIFLETARLDESTKDNYREIYERMIKPRFGHRRLMDVNEEAIERWVRDLEAEARERRRRTGRRSKGWVAGQMTPFRSAMTKAVRWGRIEENPFRYVRLSEIEPYEPGEVETGDPTKVLDRKQLQQLYTAARSGPLERKYDEYEALVRCASELGLRTGEVRGLRFTDFDLALRKVKVARQIDTAGRVKWLKGKTGRTLPVPERLAHLILALQTKALADGRPGGYVFAGQGGGPISKATANAALKTMLERVGLVDSEGRRLISYHGLRHTCASLLLAEGVAPIKVSRFLGHASLQVTLTIYAHLLGPDELDGLADVFDRFNAA